MPNYNSPYTVKNLFSQGALRLSRMDGEDLTRIINFDYVKIYYV